MSAEEWLPIVGTGGLYEVSNWGRVRAGAALAVQILDRSGYWRAVLTVDGAKFTALVHRLVATAFIENPESLPIVNHIDGDKRNAFAENLEWVSPRANAIHAVATGLKPRRQPVKKVTLAINTTRHHYATFQAMVKKAKATIHPSYTQGDLMTEMIWQRFRHLAKPGTPPPRFNFLDAPRESF